MSEYKCDGTCPGNELGDCSHSELPSLKAQLEQVTRERDEALKDVEARAQTVLHWQDQFRQMRSAFENYSSADLRSQLEAANAGAAEARALQSSAEAVAREAQETARKVGEGAAALREALEAIELRAQTGFLAGTYEARGRVLKSIEEQARAALALLRERQ